MIILIVSLVSGVDHIFKSKRRLFDMHVTEKEAREKQCPMNRQSSSCLGPSCMCWNWVFAPVLTKLVYKSEQDFALAGVEKPDFSDGKWAVATGDEHEAAWHKYIEQCRNLSLNFVIPVGWTASGVPTFDDTEEPFWFLDLKRDFDPNAIGYCGLAGGAL
ncbi:hypothetical protein [Oryzomonas rubra]|uniref:Uncharacterized protein n=1 Tax=Oryzomonas rubra TaxID=2509454 RepID=A0A5A9X6U1_9BACT|nr:hypothetical protein [Oryzomonas rubra]KAA0888746.1 hypothetical protein ET418_15310 [Oryzomonas rubra]